MKYAIAGLLAVSAVSARADLPTALMFWRADCPPCLVEVRNAAAYIRAAGGAGRVIFVGLQEEEPLRRAAERYALPPETFARADGDPETVLKAYGGSAGLPQAVIVGASGQTCFHHEGLLGTDMLRQALKSCGETHARH